jgi:hypothetical protein
MQGTNVKILYYYLLKAGPSGSRGIRRRSTAARLLRSWVRIPPGYGCLSVVCVVRCQVEVSATGWSLVQRSTTDCGASLCVIKKPRERGGHSPRWAAEPENINKLLIKGKKSFILAEKPLVIFVWAKFKTVNLGNLNCPSLKIQVFWDAWCLLSE